MTPLFVPCHESQVLEKEAGVLFVCSCMHTKSLYICEEEKSDEGQSLPAAERAEEEETRN